jgi:hypothetical protein
VLLDRATILPRRMLSMTGAGQLASDSYLTRRAVGSRTRQPQRASCCDSLTLEEGVDQLVRHAIGLDEAVDLASFFPIRAIRAIRGLSLLSIVSLPTVPDEFMRFTRFGPAMLK